MANAVPGTHRFGPLGIETMRFRCGAGGRYTTTKDYTIQSFAAVQPTRLERLLQNSKPEPGFDADTVAIPINRGCHPQQ
jgi:hypothetical protein